MFKDTDSTKNGGYWHSIRIRKKWDITREDFSEDIDHFSALEMKSNGMERILNR